MFEIGNRMNVKLSFVQVLPVISICDAILVRTVISCRLKL